MENNATLQLEFRGELENILGYWEKFTVDEKYGGFYGRLTNDNEVVEGAIKGSVLNARILWSFSAAYHLTKNARYLQMAERSLSYIKDHFIDQESGGVYWSVTASGAPADMKKQLYAIAFTIYGLTEYHRAHADEEALDLAKKLYRDIEAYSYDALQGGYMEALTRDWKPIADLRLSDRDANEKKTMNTHLHILEAYTNLYRVWQDENLATKIRELIRIFTDHIVDLRTHHLNLFFDEQWGLRSDVISYGHDIEASWLLPEAAEVLEDPALLRQIKDLSIKIAIASTGGLNPDGSMSYEFSRAENHMIAERHWWVQAEAIVGFLNAGELTGEAHFYRKFHAAWDYTKKQIIDDKKGEWFWGRTADGAVMEGQDKVGFWKCPYHNSRACIEVIRRLGSAVVHAVLLLLFFGGVVFAEETPDAALRIFLNQVGFDSHGPKMAVIEADAAFTTKISFTLVNTVTGKTEYSGWLRGPQQLKEWAPGKWFYQAAFSSFSKPGHYKLNFSAGGNHHSSETFVIGQHELARRMISAIIHYYHKQRANTATEWSVDEHVRLFGSEKTVDLRGGWCDASGDVSKYFSHLAYANFMSPQQIPLVTWSMANTEEAIPALLSKWGLRDSLESEALWGADYLMRSLSKEGYFYMTVFSYFSKDPNARRVVGLHANSVTTDEYQCAFREGGGMAIAALARISQWKKKGAYTSAQYLEAASRAFAHLLLNNTRYDDDGKENIIDDYCALMAATELWIATDSALYRDEARKRADRLVGRMTEQGYFLAGDTRRPFWHASDAGLPVVALTRYAGKEKDSYRRNLVVSTIRKALEYQLKVTGEVSNPFGYARQTFLFHDSVRTGFFIPHENETGWWWQGENARLGSLATAALVGGRLVYPRPGGWGVKDSLSIFAARQMSWILGCNPYSICFMYKFGRKNVPYMHSSFGHGSEEGGISNGITGKDGNPDGSGIDFRTSAEGNEWRWTEQWLPHAAWFLQALTATLTTPQL